MIHRLRIQNYKALRDVTLELTPMHVLIGPNDSGKSSILEALAALGRLQTMDVAHAFPGHWQGTDLVWQRRLDAAVSLSAQADLDSGYREYGVALRFASEGRSAIVEHESVLPPSGEPVILQRGARATLSRAFRGTPFHPDDARHVNAALVRKAFADTHLCRWQPGRLGLAVTFQAPIHRPLDESGYGMGVAINDILGRDRQRFEELERRFLEWFPVCYSAVQLIREQGVTIGYDAGGQPEIRGQSEGIAVHLKLAGADVSIPSRMVSDGVLYVLAYLALLYQPEPPRVLLIEEPENGLHPLRLKETVAILRELVGDGSKTQVLMTTHSPYLLDSFEPHEATITQRQEDGSVSVHRMSELPRVQQQLRLFSLGEIWTSEGEEGLVARRRKAPRTRSSPEPAPPDETAALPQSTEVPAAAGR